MPPSSNPLAPDAQQLLDAVAALHECIDLIEADGPKGGMWGQTYGYALRHAQEKCWALFPPPEPAPSWIDQQLERFLTIRPGGQR